MSTEYITRHSDDDANSRAMYGYASNLRGDTIISSTSTTSLVFFTRPQLNLSDVSVSRVRQLSWLLTPKDASIQRWIRATLDPRVMDPAVNRTPLSCPLVDNTQSFIPLLTNACTKIDGFPNQEQSTFVSTPGRAKEVFILPDDEPKVDGPIDLTCTFRAARGSSISMLLETWAAYGGYRYAGHLYRYMDYIIGGWLDDNCKLFTLILDHTGQKVDRIMATIPGNWTVSAKGDRYTHNTADSKQLESEHTYVLRVPSLRYNDPRTIYDFNDVVTFHNESMIDELRADDMLLIRSKYLEYFTNLIYYRIDPTDNVLERWIKKDPGNIIANKLLAANIISSIEDPFDTNRAKSGRNRPPPSSKE